MLRTIVPLMTAFTLGIVATGCGDSDASDPATTTANSAASEPSYRLAELDDGILRVVHSAATQTFVVDDELIVTAEDSLPAALAEAEIDVNLASYYRRYFGPYDGQDVLELALSCRAAPTENFGEIITTDDGGDCFIEARYDVTDGEWTEIRTNGPDAIEWSR